MYRISELARLAGLSRSTLLYYDRIGLLKPSGRTEAGYRQYSPADRERLATICSLRAAGLTMDDISRILSKGEEAEPRVLQRRLLELGDEIRALQSQQHLLAKMLKVQSLGELSEKIDKKAWTEMLRAAGMDDAAMKRWHAEFERRAPEAHHQFLLSLGISEEEARMIREMSQR
jgi:MerR family transcriptional regulator, thiopeptide resistance regulator